MDDSETPIEQVLAAIPYARFLGLKIETAGDEMTAVLPYSPHLIGNPLLPALHGGVLGAFMEMCALAQLVRGAGQAGAKADRTPARLPRAIDVSIEYLRSGRPLTVYARARVNKVGRRIANVHVEAWQEAREAPIAFLRAHFLMPEPEGAEPAEPAEASAQDGQGQAPA